MSRTEPSSRTEPCPRWIRAYREGLLVIDSRRARYAWTDRPFPVFAFPSEDVDREVVDVASEVDGLVVPEWEQMDTWLEEDDIILGHPRDPHHRVDARRSSRHVRVRLGGVTVAESRRPTVVFETGLDPRFYLPPTDVHQPSLIPTDTSTTCPYKGIARYWSVRAGDAEVQDGAWAYPIPMPDQALLAGLICFFQERLEVEVDGERV